MKVFSGSHLNNQGVSTGEHETTGERVKVEEQVERILRDKPERLCLDPWELEPLVDSLSGTKVAIAELAGRDSIAAAIKALEEDEIGGLLPVYTYTGTEYGSFDYLDEAVEWLKGRLGRRKVWDLVILGSPKFWHALNGRWVKELIRRYGFYTPCIGCHIYLHASRIPLARALSVKRIISGEREYHGGLEKINQIPLAISAYQFLLSRFDVTLLTPLVKVRSDEEIDEIIGTKWHEMGDQLQCVLSANYRDATGNFSCGPEHFDLIRIQGYLSEFALPTASRVIEGLLRGGEKDFVRMARQVLEERPRLMWDYTGGIWPSYS